MGEGTIAPQLEALAAFPAALRQQVAGLSDEQLRYRPAAGEWSIVEIIGHLIDVEALYVRRIGQMISAENPILERIDQEALVEQRDYQSKQAAQLLATFAEQRAAALDEVRYIRPANLARTGVHYLRGQVTIAELLGVWSDHDQNHLRQVAANIAALR